MPLLVLDHLPSSAVRRVFTFVLLLGAMGAGHAADFFWPGGPAPCHSTLQACVVGVPDHSRILIRDGDGSADGHFVVQQSVDAFAKNLELTAAPGVVVDFGAGHSVRFDSTLMLPEIPASFSLVIQDLGFVSGWIEIISDAQSASSSRQYLVEGVRIRQTGLDRCGVRFRHGFYYTTPPLGTATFSLRNSQLSGRIGACISGATGAWNVNLIGNRFRATTALASGFEITPERAGFASGQIRITNNTIEADASGNLVAGLLITTHASDGPLKLADQVLVRNNLFRGISSPGGGSAIAIEPYDETFLITNNTVIDSNFALALAADPGFDGIGTIRIANNILYRNETLSIISPELSGIVSVDHNLIYGTTQALRGDLPASTTGELNVDPEFLARDNPRPRAGSPAIDAGSNALVATDDVDLDGNSRRAGTAVDLGAFETTATLSARHQADAGNTFANYTWIGPALGAPAPSQRLFITPMATPGLPLQESSRGNAGLFFLDAERGWSPYWEHLTSMESGAGFAVTRMDDLSFRHLTSTGNIVNGFQSTIDHPLLNNNPFAIATVSHHYNGDLPFDSYHDHPVALIYRNDLGRWVIENQDAAPMNLGIGFNVWVAPTFSPNATIVAATGLGRVPIRHPRLDGNACALAQVSRRLPNPSSPFNPMRYVLDYVTVPGATLSGYWSLLSRGNGSEPSGFPLAAFPDGTQFNVLIDGRNAGQCGGTAREPLLRWVNSGVCTVTEGQSGTSTCLLRIDLSESSTEPVLLLTATEPGTALSDVDYVFDPGTIRTIPAGSMHLDVPVQIIADTQIEPDEMFQLRVTVLSGAANLLPNATIVISNDDTQTVDALFRDGFE